MIGLIIIGVVILAIFFLVVTGRDDSGNTNSKVVPTESQNNSGYYGSLPDTAEDYFEVGKIFYEQGENEKAFFAFLKGAELGHKHAMNRVAYAYMVMGQGVECDLTKCAFWTKKAAELGQIAAMDRLAQFYISGTGGIEQDDDKAKYWLQKVADEDDGKLGQRANEVLDNYEEQKKFITSFWQVTKEFGGIPPE